MRLQKSIIKKSEKCEFLEEHVSQLVGELKKKNKIIHHYIMREDAGALINSKSDENKVRGIFDSTVKCEKKKVLNWVSVLPPFKISFPFSKVFVLDSELINML